jgi:hypothetical protein
MEICISILNQIFDIIEKTKNTSSYAEIERNMNRMIHTCEEAGYSMHNPISEKYSDTRTDCDANIVGSIGKNMQIVQVIKPIIFSETNGIKTIVQKAIVMVEAM